MTAGRRVRAEARTGGPGPGLAREDGVYGFGCGDEGVRTVLHPASAKRGRPCRTTRRAPSGPALRTDGGDRTVVSNSSEPGGRDETGRRSQSRNRRSCVLAARCVRAGVPLRRRLQSQRLLRRRCRPRCSANRSRSASTTAICAAAATAHSWLSPGDTRPASFDALLRAWAGRTSRARRIVPDR